MSFFRQLFIWWHGATLGTRITTWFTGKAVGEDQFGNRYFESKNGKRRWVMFAGTVEASRVPPEWHGWMHHTFDKPLAAEQTKAWQKEHKPNLSGTKDAYRPSGSLWKEAQRPPATGDYEAWTPS